MLKAIAIDDEPVALEIIKILATRVNFLQVEAYFTSAAGALAYLTRHPVDLIFLDMQMPGLSGMDFLRSLSSSLQVIITTAYSEYALEGFELDAADYLLKPFSEARFLKACSKAHDHYLFRKGRSEAPWIFVKCGQERVRVELSSILYLESVGNYVRFVLSGRRLLSRLTMSEAENMLHQGKFLRVHRSFVVGTEHITKVDKSHVWIGSQPIPIGSSYAELIAAQWKTN
jgi:two-component system LytT family response regulator